jgi:Tfp pilus assembly protein PilO
LKTRSWLFIILILVLVAVYYVMGTGYLKQRQEYRAMASRLDEVAQILAQIPAFPTDLEEQLNEAQRSYEAVRDSFPDQMNTTGVINAILGLADDTGVKAIPLITQPWMPININNQDTSVFRLSVTASGEFTRLVDFIDRLETGEPPTLVIESMLVDRTTDITDE